MTTEHDDTVNDGIHFPESVFTDLGKARGFFEAPVHDPFAEPKMTPQEITEREHAEKVENVTKCIYVPPGFLGSVPRPVVNGDVIIDTVIMSTFADTVGTVWTPVLCDSRGRALVAGSPFYYQGQLVLSNLNLRSEHVYAFGYGFNTSTIYDGQTWQSCSTTFVTPGDTNSKYLQFSFYYHNSY